MSYVRVGRVVRDSMSRYVCIYSVIHVKTANVRLENLNAGQSEPPEGMIM
jgi:hypothetical protein